MDPEIYCMLILSAVLASAPSVFLEVRERVKPQSQLQTWLQPSLLPSKFMLILDTGGPISSLERLLTGSWSPDMGQGKQAELGAVAGWG